MKEGGFNDVVSANRTGKGADEDDDRVYEFMNDCACAYVRVCIRVYACVLACLCAAKEHTSTHKLIHI